MRILNQKTRRLMVETVRNGYKIKDVARIFGISRKTVWKWCKRTRKRGRRDSFSWGSQRIRVVLVAPTPYIRHLLETVLGITWQPILLSRQSINMILKKHQRNGFPPGGKREWKFFRAEHPNDLWQIDIKGPFTIDGQRMLALIITDDHSRFRIYCTLHMSVSTRKVIAELFAASLYMVRQKRCLLTMVLNSG